MRCLAFDPIENTKDGAFSIYILDCNNKISLLDYEEFFRLETNYQYNLGEQNQKVESIIEEGILRFSKFAPVYEKFMSKRYNELAGKVKFVRNVNFGEIDDQLTFASFKDCKTEIIAKGLNVYSADKTLYIDDELYKKLDNFSKAGLFFNYLINQDRIYQFRDDSTFNARYINALLSSSKFSLITNSDLYYLRNFFNYRSI